MSSFTSLNLRPELLKACRKQGFTGPTAIQAMVIPVVAAGRDAVVESMTGSGKTLAYGLPMLNREPIQKVFAETLIVAPTRELAEQIEAELVRTRGTLDRPIVLLTGGGGMDKQKLKLDAGAAIIVGTMGRIEEMLERQLLRLDHLRTIILDEVDELLRGGFSGNVAKLLGSLPRERQTLIFSATIPTEVDAVAKRFTRDAARLKLSAARETPAQLTHRVLLTTVDERIEKLAGYLEAERPYQTLIFCGTRHETEEVRAALTEAGLEAQFLHGELSPNRRRQLLETFRSGDLPVLVASDLAARGLDLPGVDLIVNYSLPEGVAAYLHRAGRTGRAGRAGVVLSLVIGQQHDQYEKLKGSFAFESMEISPRGKLYSHPARTREERDLTFRKLPAKPERDWSTPKPKLPPKKEEKEAPYVPPPRGRKADRVPEKQPRRKTSAPSRGAMGEQIGGRKHDSHKGAKGSKQSHRAPKRHGR